MPSAATDSEPLDSSGDNLVRFGSHAPIIWNNGIRSLIPADGKRPAAGVNDYPQYGFHPADKIERAWWLKHHALANIAMVMNGRVVVIDIDVLDEDLVKELLALAATIFGLMGWRRVGQAPKVSLFFRALDPIQTYAGAVVEIFCSPGSKLVLLFGRHPDTGGEYEWLDYSPLSHRLDQMPGVYSQQVVAYLDAARALVKEAGYVKPSKARADGSAAGPSDSVTGVGDMMSEILRAIGVNGADPTAVASSYFEQARDGAKHYAMVAAVSALVLRGYSDQQIVEALIDAYRRRVHDDPGLKNLRLCPLRVRRGLLRRGAVLPARSEADLDDDQCAALDRAKRRLWDILDDEHDDRDSVVEQSIRMASHVKDEQVRAALAPSVAYWLALDGLGEAALLAVIELLSGRRDVGLARWALSKRRAHG
jgi:Bifunctional DNA primase/polymerase, N-terminal